MYKSLKSIVVFAFDKSIPKSAEATIILSVTFLNWLKLSCPILPIASRIASIITLFFSSSED